MLNVALIGAGSMGGNHFGCWQKIAGESGDAKVSAVVDIDLEAARQVAGELAVFATLDEALAGAPVDIVDVCTPTPTHMDMSVRALEAGKHLLLEKPMARTLEQCDAIIRAANASGKTAMVAHVLRFFPEFAAAKAAVDAGSVGKAAIVRTTRGGAFPRGEDSWYADLDQSGGVALDLIIHDFDWLQWCFGRPTRVFAKGLAPRKMPTKDYALVTIRFESGVIAHVEGTWIRPTGFETKFEIAGDGGLINFQSRDASSLRVNSRAGAESRAAVEVPESPVYDSPYYLEIRHFLDCVKSGDKPSITLEDARTAVAMSLGALESMQTGQPVELVGGLAK